jgi:dihydroxyacetone kinase-like protein
MDCLDINAIESVLSRLKQIMDEHRDRLLELDRDLGDGDLGLTMTKAFSAAHETASTSGETLPGKLLMRVGMAIAKAAPSTMGTLVATGFMRGGKAVGEDEQLGVGQLAAFFRAFTDGIMERGKTQPGNKTVVDSLYPAAEALEQAAAEGKEVTEALTEAVAAARQGNEAARMMKSQHGKAAVYQDQTIGKEDPGASVGVLIIQGFASAVRN